MQDVGFTAKEAIQIISSPVLTKASKSNSNAAEGVYDVRDTPEEPFVTWWNDLEKDSRYNEWSKNMQEVIIYMNPQSISLANSHNIVPQTCLSWTVTFSKKKSFQSDHDRGFSSA